MRTKEFVQYGEKQQRYRAWPPRAVLPTDTRRRPARTRLHKARPLAEVPRRPLKTASPPADGPFRNLMAAVRNPPVSGTQVNRPGRHNSRPEPRPASRGNVRQRPSFSDSDPRGCRRLHPPVWGRDGWCRASVRAGRRREGCPPGCRTPAGAFPERGCPMSAAHRRRAPS